MSYWNVLTQARNALEEGRFQAAEEAHDRAHQARDADRRRVFVSEQVPDGLRRLWRRVAGQGDREEPGRWEQAVAAFRRDFRDQAEARLQQASRQLELGVQEEPDTSVALLDAALYLSVASGLSERRLPVAPLLVALFELLPLTGRLPGRELITTELDLDPETRLHLATLARDHLERLPEDERRAWARRLLDLLRLDEAACSPAQAEEARWLAASVADLHGDDVETVLERWAQVDAAATPDSRRQWSRLRRLEILGGCDRHQLPVPRHEEARRLAALLPAEGDEEVPRRRRAALAVLAHRRPAADPDRGWISASVGEDRVVRAVFWWGTEPRDTASWSSGDDLAALGEFLAAAGGRVVWQGAAPTGDALPDWPREAAGRAIAPYLEALLEPLLPATGWNDDLARRLALARSGAWRDRWRSDLGHPLLRPPGQDGRFGPQQTAIEPALQTGLLWLAVLGRVADADPALRAGLGELGRRGDPAAAFLHRCSVLGVADGAAADRGFEAWTLPLLWTRPDPLTTARGADPEDAPREDLAGQDVAVVTTGRPALALAAWGPGQRRWRVVLDRLDRLGDLRRLAREAYGPVTVVPPRGQVHHLGAALQLLEDLATSEAAPGDELLAVCHWIRLVETHNGDLLDYQVWRPRPAGTCPLYDRYATMLAELPRQSISGEENDGGGWSGQYAQRVRRSGLAAGLIADLPGEAEALDAVWGVFDGSEASWVFLDAAAVHWTLARRGEGAVTRQHALLAPRGRRHLSLLGGVGLFPEALAAWFDEVLAPYGRPYQLALDDAAPPRLRLAGEGPLPHACLDPVAGWAALLERIRDAGAETAVLLPRQAEGTAFWRSAAAGAFGAVRWRTAGDLDAVTAERLVVPTLASLEGLARAIAPSDADPASWTRHDAAGRRVRHAATRRVALECSALLATPAATVELLDLRWWRLLAAPELDPGRARERAGATAAELVDLPAPASAPPGLEDWVRDRIPVPGLLADWPGAPLAAADPVDQEGVRIHPAPASLLWRDHAADLLRRWESGRTVDRLLVIGERPPPGAAALVAHLAAAGATVPSGAADETLAPLVWLRPAQLLALLQQGAGAPDCDRALVLDLDGLLPLAEEPGTGGARLLGWLVESGPRRVDLVGDPPGAAWCAYLATALGARLPEGRRDTGGWPSLRRAAGVRLPRLCAVCGHRGVAAVDGSICTACGAALAAAGVDEDDETVQGERAAQLLGQADLGREGVLEFWAPAPSLAALRQAIRSAEGAAAEPGAEAEPGAAAEPGAEIWTLPDGRRWRLRALAPGCRAEGSAMLLGAPADPAQLRPRAPANAAAELSLLYDRHDLQRWSHGPWAGRSCAEAIQRLLDLLADPRWLEPERPGETAATRLRPQVSLWRIGWLAGLAPAEVGRQLALLRWAGVLGGELPAAAVAPPADAQVRLQVQVPARDMELILASLAADLERNLEPLLAGGSEGAWHAVTAPPSLAPGEEATAGNPPLSRLDLLLALAASHPNSRADRLGYRAPAGAWFSRRRHLTWYGDRRRLAGDLLHELDTFAVWIRDRLGQHSRVERDYVTPLDERPGDPLLERRLLLGQELGFWTRGGASGASYIALAELHRLRAAPTLAPDNPAVELLRSLATDRDRWRARLAATPPGGVVQPLPEPTDRDEDADTGGSWWRRGGKDPVTEVGAAVREHLGAAGSGRLILEGTFGTGRTDALLAGMAATAAGRRAPVWCPDEATAVRVHLAARRVDACWQPRVKVWRSGDPLPPAGTAAPGERPLLVVAELQRFPREIAYRLQESAREGRLVITVDAAEVRGAREDLFLTTPRRDELRPLRRQVLQAQQPWRVTWPLLPSAIAEPRGGRRERGQVVSRRAGTLDECASAVAAATASGRLGELVALTAPLPEDAALLRRALADRGWAAVDREALEGWLLPGVLEVAAALADAHRRRHGSWPGGAAEQAPPRSGTLLGAFLPAREAEDWSSWLRSLPDEVLADGASFLGRLRRSPWHRVCCLESEGRKRVAALLERAAGTEPGELIDPLLWQAWRRTLAPLLGRGDLDTGPPAVVLAAAAEPGGAAAESAVYVCFGPEPESVHRQVLSRASDRLLVLYQEHSPLPGEAEKPGG